MSVAPTGARSRCMRWLAALLLIVASPCATELALGSLAAAFSGDDVAIDACCADRQAPREDASHDGEGEPDARRSVCGCCHSFEPTTFTPAFVSPVRIAAPRAPDTSAGHTIDGHAEPPFRPPAFT